MSQKKLVILFSALIGLSGCFDDEHITEQAGATTTETTEVTELTEVTQIKPTIESFSFADAQKSGLIVDIRPSETASTDEEKTYTVNELESTGMIDVDIWVDENAAYCSQGWVDASDPCWFPEKYGLSLDEAFTERNKYFNAQTLAQLTKSGRYIKIEYNGEIENLTVRPTLTDEEQDSCTAICEPIYMVEQLQEIYESPLFGDGNTYVTHFNMFELNYGNVLKYILDEVDAFHEDNVLVNSIFSTDSDTTYVVANDNPSALDVFLQAVIEMAEAGHRVVVVTHDFDGTYRVSSDFFIGDLLLDNLESYMTDTVTSNTGSTSTPNKEITMSSIFHYEVSSYYPTLEASGLLTWLSEQATAAQLDILSWNSQLKTYVAETGTPPLDTYPGEMNFDSVY